MGAALVRESGVLSAKIRHGLAGAFRGYRRERVFAGLRIGAPGRARKRSRVPARRFGPLCASWTGFIRTSISWKVCCRCSAGRNAPRPFVLEWIAPPGTCVRSRPSFCARMSCAQLLRVRLLAEALGVLPLDQAAASHEAQLAASFQIESGDPRLAGGFLFGRKQGKEMPFVNPVSTAFCLQALAIWETESGARAVSPRAYSASITKLNPKSRVIELPKNSLRNASGNSTRDGMLSMAGDKRLDFDSPEAGFFQVEARQHRRNRMPMRGVDIEMRGENREAFRIRRLDGQQAPRTQLRVNQAGSSRAIALAADAPPPGSRPRRRAMHPAARLSIRTDPPSRPPVHWLCKERWNRRLNRYLAPQCRAWRKTSSISPRPQPRSSTGACSRKRDAYIRWRARISSSCPRNFSANFSQSTFANSRGALCCDLLHGASQRSPLPQQPQFGMDQALVFGRTRANSSQNRCWISLGLALHRPFEIGVLSFHLLAVSWRPSK